MKVYFNQRNGAVKAEGKYDIETGRLTVLKGAIVSPEVRLTEKTYGRNKIMTLRNECVEDRILLKNMEFNSATAAANFVLGNSINGLIAWKNSEGKTIKEIISEKD